MPPCIQHGDTGPYCTVASEDLEKRCGKKIAFLEKDVEKNHSAFFPSKFCFNNMYSQFFETNIKILIEFLVYI